MKNKYGENFKKFLSNSNNKTVFSLSLWLLFLVFVIIFVRVTSPKKISKSNSSINRELVSYEYSYGDDKNVIYGKMYNGKHVFILSNHKYYYDASDIYEFSDYKLNKVSDLDISYLKITPKMITSLIKNIKYSFDDGVYIYKVPLSNFVNAFDGDVPVNLDSISGKNITVYKDSLKSSFVKIDLSSYDDYCGKENNGLLRIEFYEQNKLNNFTEEYDKMIGVIK